MGLINAVKEHGQRIPIEEKFMVFEKGTKGEAVMIPLKDIVDIDVTARLVGKSVDNTSFYVKSGIALDSGTSTTAILMVAAWKFSSSSSDNATKLAENGEYFFHEFQRALAQNTHLYHVDMSGFPYAIDAAGPLRATITWTPVVAG